MILLSRVSIFLSISEIRYWIKEQKYSLVVKGLLSITWLISDTIDNVSFEKKNEPLNGFFKDSLIILKVKGIVLLRIMLSN
jgi:hypothetical protein